MSTSRGEKIEPRDKIETWRRRQGSKQSFNEGIHVELKWMQCPNEKCRDVLVHVNRMRFNMDASMSVGYGTANFIALPRNVTRPVDDLVPEPFASAFGQASMILTDSPGMSAVLSRKLQADLLTRYADLKQTTLNAQIDAFINDEKHPAHVKENLHHLRELANMAAHTTEDLSTGEIIQTTPEEAEWGLDVIESLFEYLIIAPERNKQRRAIIDEKIAKAGRKAIKPLSSDDGG